MHCYVALSNVFLLMPMKMCIHSSLLRRQAIYNICLCFIVLYNFVLYSVVVNLVGIKFSWISLSFLSMIIHEVLDVVFLMYNICSAWFLDIRISTCFV